MVKKSSLLLIMGFFLIGCLSYRTEYGRKRFDYYRFSTKPNTNATIYKLIDTAKLYRLISKEYDELSKQLNKRHDLHLKFYNNGRVGQFIAYNESDLMSLNPKRATMGVYNYSDNKLYVQYYLENPQGDGLIGYEFNIEKTKDTLKLIDKTSTYSYEEVPLAKAFLIYTPDW